MRLLTFAIIVILGFQTHSCTDVITENHGSNKKHGNGTGNGEDNNWDVTSLNGLIIGELLETLTSDTYLVRFLSGLVGKINQDGTFPSEDWEMYFDEADCDESGPTYLASVHQDVVETLIVHNSFGMFQVGSPEDTEKTVEPISVQSLWESGVCTNFGDHEDHDGIEVDAMDISSVIEGVTDENQIGQLVIAD